MGQMGDCRRSRDPRYHEPFLSDVLLSELEKNRSWNRKKLAQQTSLLNSPFDKEEVYLGYPSFLNY
jgi:hypothetical protein